MKKHLFLRVGTASLAILLFLAMLSCARDDETPVISSPPSLVETSVKDDVPIDDFVQIRQENFQYTNGRGFLQYPVLSEAYGGALTDMINDRLRTMAWDQFHAQNLGILDIAEFEYRIEEIRICYRSSRFLSAFAYGYTSIAGTAHNRVFSYTINVDIASGEFLHADALISDLDGLKALMAAEGELLWGNPHLLEENTMEQILEMYREDYSIYPAIAFDGEYLLVDVDVLYSLGGYAVFRIPLEHTLPCLNKESPLIAEQMSRDGMP